MKIDAVVFTRADENNTPGRVQFDPDDIEKKDSFLARQSVPPIIVISENNKNKLDPYMEQFDFRGSQPEAVDLTRFLKPAKGKISLVIAKYVQIGRLTNSIYGYLAKEDIAHAMAILAVKNKLFKDLWEKAIPGASDALYNVFLSHQRQQKEEDKEQIHCENENDLSKLLPLLEEDPDIEQKYVGKSREAKFIRQLIVCASQNENPVLILGDSGTGKGLAARLIHDHSERKNKPFVSVNCGAIPYNLFESELFGHKEGAFTGAICDKLGLWQAAGEGTLFLDEIGDLGVHQQVKILRALHEKTAIPLGSAKEDKLNARIIAATNRHLYSMVAHGQFREDLYYRLRQGMLIYTCPLRDRMEDIQLIAKSVWETIAPGNHTGLSDAILTKLEEYSWAGNVRELKSVLNNLHSLFHGVAELSVNHLQAILSYEGQVSRSSETATVSKKIANLFNKIETIRHLLRAEDLIQAVANDIKPFISAQKEGTKKEVQDMSSALYNSLKHRLDELENLCFYPQRFGSSKVFDTFNLLRSKLLFFSSLMHDDSQAACQYWQDNANDILIKTKNVVSEGIGEVLEGSKLDTDKGVNFES
jgi:DNA-binding NtrC family response regulator